MSAVDTIQEFAAWCRRAVPSVETTEYVTLDFYENVETTYPLDLGVAGEVEVDVYIPEYNIYRDEFEVEASVEVDVEELIRNESDVELSDLYAALDEAVEALNRPTSTAPVPAALDLREEQAGRAALAAVQVFLDGDGDEAIRRALGSALTRAGFGVEVDQRLTVRFDELRAGDVVQPAGYIVTADWLDGVVEIVNNGRPDRYSSVPADRPFEIIRRSTSTSNPAPGYEPLTVEVDRGNGISLPLSDLRLGDNITGETFGRLVSVDAADDTTMTYTLDRDGTRRQSTDRLSTSWYVEPVVVPGRSRDDIPTALDLFRGSAVPSPF